LIFGNQALDRYFNLVSERTHVDRHRCPRGWQGKRV